MIELLLAVQILMLVAILLRLRERDRKAARPTPERKQPSATGNPPLIHEILRWRDDGRHEVIDSVPNSEGISVPIKEALRDPSKAVRWGHSGTIERGTE